METVVVNIFGGPGCGKSTTRAGLFALLKTKGVVCEEASEWCKNKVYEESKYVFTDQFYIFAKQRKMLKQLEGKVNVIVTDSPILLSAVYDNTNNKLFEPLVMSEFNRFNNINILLRREKPYVTVGRNQTEEEARQVDDQVKKYLDQNGVNYCEIAGTAEAPSLIYHLVSGLWRLS